MDHHWLLYLYARERLHELAQQAADQRLRTEAKAGRQVERYKQAAPAKLAPGLVESPAVSARSPE